MAQQDHLRRDLLGGSEQKQPTTIMNLKIKTIEEKAVTPQNNQLGNLIASSDDITEIDGDSSLPGGNTQVSISVFAGQISGSVKLDTSCRESQARPSRMAVNSRPEGSSYSPVW
jgi:hypothetical protein